MEIKVECPCGQHYSFDAEPVNGRMPVEVQCPACGADGTEAANRIIQSQSGSQPRMVVRPAVRIATAASAVARSPALPAAAGPAPSSLPRAPAPMTGVPQADGYVEPRRPNAMLGVAGAVGFGFVAMMAWYYLIKLTGYELGIVAWGVGLLTGLGARVVGRDTSDFLGVVAGACALFAIVGGKYLYVNSEVQKEIAGMANQAYETQMENARAALKIDATSDAEVRQFLASHGEKGETPTDAQIKEFRERGLSKLKDFVAGKPSRAEFTARVNKAMNKFGLRWLVLKNSVSLFTLLWVFLGVASAYKLATGASDD